MRTHSLTPRPVFPGLAQLVQESMGGFWPIWPPLASGTSILKGSWTLFEQPERVQRVEHILLARVTACMPSQQGSFTQNLYLKRRGFEGQFLPRLFRRDPVAIGFVGHLTVAVQMHLASDTALKRPRGEGTQVGLFFLPGLPNTHRLAMDYPHIVAPTRCQQMAIELLKGGHARHGHEEISAAQPLVLCRHVCNTPPF